MSFQVSNAQTTNEWLNQKATQKKYLLKQIAAFKLYLGYVQEGYSIAQKGLNAIGKIKKDDLDLHDDFFNSFKRINGKVGSYAKVADIVALQVKIVQTYKGIYKYVQSTRLITPGEVDVIYQTFTNLLNSSSADIEELIRTVAANELEMKDDERLKRIDVIYRAIQDKYAFARRFEEETKVFVIQREKEKNDIQSSRALHGIKN